jgi:hypothetical protein
MRGFILDVKNQTSNEDVEVIVKGDGETRQFTIRARPTAGGEDIFNAVLDRESALALGNAIVDAVNALPPPTGSNELAPKAEAKD